MTSPVIACTLEEVLSSVRPLEAGMFVTLLAPMVSAARDAAAAGVHPAPAATDIGLTSDGRPVLLLTTPVEDSASASLAAFRRLLDRSRSRCPSCPDIEEAADLVGLEATLYRVAPPMPLGTLPKSPTEESVAATPARHRRRHPIDGWRGRVASLARRHRGPLLAATVILLGAATASLLGGTADERAAEASTAAPTTSPASSSGTAPASPPPTAGGPADEAARALVAAAGACETGECLRALTTADSPLRSQASAREILPDAASVASVVTEAEGGSALVSLRASGGTTVASVLIVRTEAGWLIRDVYAGAAS